MAVTTTRNDKKEVSVGIGVVGEVDDIRHMEIPKRDFRQATLKLVGVSPLITHPWSEKAAKALEDSQTGKAKQQKGARNPDEEWRAAAYVIPGKEALPEWQPGKYFFPAAAFKHAFLYGVGQLDDVKKFPKTKATGWIFIDDDPVLQFSSVSLRTDIGRNPTQPVYRPQFNEWSVDLRIGYNALSITIEQVAAIMDLGGFSGGVGEWRPSSPKNKSGSFGRFRVTEVTG
jgi:hypothetical protein